MVRFISKVNLDNLAAAKYSSSDHFDSYLQVVVGVNVDDFSAKWEIRWDVDISLILISHYCYFLSAKDSLLILHDYLFESFTPLSAMKTL